MVREDAVASSPAIETAAVAAESDSFCGYS